MTSDRVDLFSLVHKGLRADLFATAQAIARADFGLGAEAERVVGLVRRTLGLAEEHAEHEDVVILPVLDRVAPALGSDLRGAHARLDGAGRELGRTVARMAAATQAERIALGRRLHEQIGRYVAEQLMHMEREETEASRALWAHCTDAQLVGLRAAIVSAIPAPRYGEWLALMLPAMSGTERAGMLAGLRGSMAVPAFEALLAPARVALGEGDWQAAISGAASR